MSKPILSIVALLLGALVCIVTTFLYSISLPACVSNNAGFGFAVPGFIAGAFGGVIAAILGVYTTVKGLPYELSIIQVVNTLIITAVILILVTTLLAIMVSGSFAHMVNHKCTLIPWSP